MQARPEARGVPWWRRTLAALLASAALLAVVEGYVLSHRLRRVDLALASSAPGASTYLLVGTDDRGDLGGFRRPGAFGDPGATPGRRADALIVVRVPEHGRPLAVTIPRDLVVVGDRRVPVRLALVRLEGLQALVTALCRNFGLAPDHVVEISFAGLREVVDALGGVEIDEPAPARDAYTALDVPAGRRRVDGEVAVSYVRSRHMEHLVGGRWVPDADGSAGREQRQRDVLGRLGRSARSTLAHPVAAQRLAWQGTGALTVSRSTGLVDLARLGVALGRAEDLRLPVDRHDGDVPWARLRPGARALLERIAPVAGAHHPSACPASTPSGP